MGLTVPYVRYAAKTAYLLENRRVAARDCHILYIISGSGVFSAEEADYALEPDTLVYYPYGTPYRISTRRKMLFYTVNFDFDLLHEDIPPMTPEDCYSGKSIDVIESIPKEYASEFSKIKVIKNAVWAEKYLFSINEKSIGQSRFCKEIQSGNLLLLLYDFLECESRTENRLCDKIKNLISENMSLKSNEIGKILGYHPYYLNEVFGKNEGISIHGYITEIRLSRAYAMIAAADKTLEEIASECGFCSLAHFSSSFKKHYGFSPGSLRKMV